MVAVAGETKASATQVVVVQGAPTIGTTPKLIVEERKDCKEPHPQTTRRTALTYFALAPLQPPLNPFTKNDRSCNTRHLAPARYPLPPKKSSHTSLRGCSTSAQAGLRR
jgi:hypothetical protein